MIQTLPFNLFYEIPQLRLGSLKLLEASSAGGAPLSPSVIPPSVIFFLDAGATENVPRITSHFLWVFYVIMANGTQGILCLLLVARRC
mmetsp:Transcript_10900/g.21091  ORF Transcript_10900/g.21091 Transcript_10900/m.21091 type:complete len:88 (+) Transcript_10900:935-1198(+)